MTSRLLAPASLNDRKPEREQGHDCGDETHEGAVGPSDTVEAVASRLQEEGDQHENEVDRRRDQQNLIAADGCGCGQLPYAQRLRTDESEDPDRHDEDDV